MPDYDIKHYELNDHEHRGLPSLSFDKKVINQFKKEQNPTIKPEKIFEGFKKDKSKKNK